MKYSILFLIAIMALSCSKDDNQQSSNEESLQDLIDLNPTLEIDFLIACAGGKDGGIFGDSDSPTTIFYYPHKQ